jgi:hypothetical protein
MKRFKGGAGYKRLGVCLNPLIKTYIKGTSVSPVLFRLEYPHNSCVGEVAVGERRSCKARHIRAHPVW